MESIQKLISRRKKSDPQESVNLELNKNSDSKNFLLSPKDLHKKFIFPKERELNTHFCLSFKEVYNLHVSEMEKKTRIRIKYIYYFLIVALIFFLVGHFELIFSYIITGYYPIIWTREDYKLNKDYFWKKWGTYWSFFFIFIFFDYHKNEVLKLIPFYFIIKCVFLIILYMPSFSAAVNIYDGFLKEFFHHMGRKFQYKEDIETLVNDFQKNVKIKKE